MRFCSPIALVVLLLIAGCGGGGGGTLAGGGGGQDVNIGSIQARAQSGSPAPLIVSGTTSLFAMSGATFTHVAYTPPRTLGNTRISFARSGGNLWTVDPSGGNLNQVTSDMLPGQWPFSSWSPDAFRVLFLGLPVNGRKFVLVGATGYGETVQNYGALLSSNSRPAWSPVSNTVIFDAPDPTTAHEQIYTATINGGAATLLTTNAQDHYFPTWSPDGKKIAYVDGSFWGDLHIMNSDGTGDTNVSQIGPKLSEPAWSPDGTRIVMVYLDSSGHFQLAMRWGDGTIQQLTQDTTNNYNPAWSPNSKKLVWSHFSGVNNDAVLMEANADMTQAFTLLQISGEQLLNPAWSPFPVQRTMLGTGGLFGNTSKAGFMFSQNGDVVQSFLMFNAATPATTTITTQSGVGTPSTQTFNISGGGGINSLSYANDLLLAPTTVIPASGFTTANGVIVSMSISDGHISLAMPYAKMSGKMQSKSGGTIYTGQFLGVFDGNGKNLAPAGATRVELSSVGKLISAR